MFSKSKLFISSILIIISITTLQAQAAVTFVDTFGSQGSGAGQFNYPASLALGPNGDLYVVGNGNRVQRFDSQGNFISEWGSAGTSNGQFASPLNIAAAADGSVYVNDSGNNRVQKFAADGTFLTQWGSSGSGDGQFNGLTGIAVAADGSVYVAEDGNDRIQKFDADGTFVSVFATNFTGLWQNPYDLTVGDNGNLFVCYNGATVTEFAPDGTKLDEWDPYGVGTGQVGMTRGIDVSTIGLVYVADISNNRISSFDTDGNFHQQFGTIGSGDGQFDSPWDVAVADNGLIYAADANNHRIVRLFDHESWLSGDYVLDDDPSTAGVNDAVVDTGSYIGTVLTVRDPQNINVPGALTIGPSGTFNLLGGQISCSSFANNGTMHWSGGTLNVTGDLELDRSTLFNMSDDNIRDGQHLQVGGVLHNKFCSITLDGGRITCGSFDNDSIFEWKSGTLAFNSNLTIDSTEPFGWDGDDRIYSGRTLEVAEKLSVTDTGRLEIRDGAIVIGTISTAPAASKIYVGTGGTFVLSGDEDNLIFAVTDGADGADAPPGEGTDGGNAGGGGSAANISMEDGTVVINGTFNSVGGNGGDGGDSYPLYQSSVVFGGGDGGNGGRGGAGSTITVNDGTLQINGTWNAIGGQGGNGGNIIGIWDQHPGFGGRGGNGGSILVNGGSLVIASDAVIDLSGGSPGTNGLDNGSPHGWMDNPSRGTNGKIKINGGTMVFDGDSIDDVLVSGTFEWQTGTVRLGGYRTIDSNNKLAGQVSTILAAGKNLEIVGTLTTAAGGTLNLGEGTASVGGPAAAPTPGAFTITNGGTFILDGGQVSCGSLDHSHGGTFQWNTGTLSLSGDLSLGQNVLPTVAVDSTLQVAGKLTVESSGTLALGGGRIECGEFDHSHGGTFQWTAGTLAVGGGLAVDGYSFNPIVSDLNLEVAQTISIGGGGDVSLAGGRIACEMLQVNTGGLLSLEGGTLEFTSPGASALVLDGGTLRVDSTAFDAMVAGARFEYNSGSFHLTDAGGYTIGANDGLIDRTLGRNDVVIARNGKLTVDNTLTVPADKSMYTYEGTIEAGQIDNSGAITVFHGKLATSYGLNNSGNLLLVDSTVSGPVDNPDGCNVNVVGDVHFTGLFSGAGGLYGSGTAYFDGGYDPGDSPAVVTLECTAALGEAGTLSIELGGTETGQYDTLVTEGDMTLDGQLDIKLLSSFEIVMGQVFKIVDARGNLFGNFKGLEEGSLVGNFGGVDLLITYAGGDGNDVFLQAVPEPSTIVYILLGLASLVRIARRPRSRTRPG